MPLMGLGHVLRERAVAAPAVLAQMAGRPLLLMEDLHSSGADQHLHPVMRQKVRDRVIMPFIVDVVIDADLGRLPDGKDIILRRQGLQSRPVQGLEGTFATAWQPFERTLIQVFQQAADLRACVFKVQ